MSKQDAQKQQAAEAALEFVESGAVVGVGTGSTVNFFIQALAKMKNRIDGAVPSSLASKKLLQDNGIPLLDLNGVGEIAVYIDGADEVNEAKQMVKGGGGALTGEKIVASASEKFVCIVDESKQVDLLGKFPVALEVIPMARGLVGRSVVKLNGDPAYRQGFVSDHGNIIIDVHNLEILEPRKMEAALNNIPGVVCCGVFAERTADVVLMATSNGVRTL
jgi:ribose 5-phosphate isomerase A